MVSKVSACVEFILVNERAAVRKTRNDFFMGNLNKVDGVEDIEGSQV